MVRHLVVVIRWFVIRWFVIRWFVIRWFVIRWFDVGRFIVGGLDFGWFGGIRRHLRYAQPLRRGAGRLDRTRDVRVVLWVGASVPDQLSDQCAHGASGTHAGQRELQLQLRADHAQLRVCQRDWVRWVAIARMRWEDSA